MAGQLLAQMRREVDDADARLGLGGGDPQAAGREVDVAPP